MERRAGDGGGKADARVTSGRLHMKGLYTEGVRLGGVQLMRGQVSSGAGVHILPTCMHTYIQTCGLEMKTPSDCGSTAGPCLRGNEK